MAYNTNIHYYYDISLKISDEAPRFNATIRSSSTSTSAWHVAGYSDINCRYLWNILIAVSNDFVKDNNLPNKEAIGGYIVIQSSGYTVGRQNVTTLVQYRSN